MKLGGTVGDIESLPFLEAIRQFQHENESIIIHLTYVPLLKAAGEVKTKPTQHSVQQLREIGLIPDIILCRSEQSLTRQIKDKISLFCSVAKDSVFDEPDVNTSIYEVPLLLRSQGVDELICKKLNIDSEPKELTEWKKILNTIENPKGKITVGIVGKYLQHQDAYKSVFESLYHAAFALDQELVIKKIESDSLTKENIKERLKGVDGVLIPGGFGRARF